MEARLVQTLIHNSENIVLLLVWRTYGNLKEYSTHNLRGEPFVWCAIATRRLLLKWSPRFFCTHRVLWYMTRYFFNGTTYCSDCISSLCSNVRLAGNANRLNRCTAGWSHRTAILFIYISRIYRIRRRLEAHVWFMCLYCRFLILIYNKNRTVSPAIDVCYD